VRRQKRHKTGGGGGETKGKETQTNGWNDGDGFSLRNQARVMMILMRLQLLHVLALLLMMMMSCAMQPGPIDYTQTPVYRPCYAAMLRIGAASYSKLLSWLRRFHSLVVLIHSKAYHPPPFPLGRNWRSFFVELQLH